VESGEGIERLYPPPRQHNGAAEWNPVKELKDLVDLQVVQQGDVEWNPVKKLNDPALTATA